MDYEDYAAKAPPADTKYHGKDSNPRTTFYGELRQISKVTDDPEGKANERLCLYVELIQEDGSSGPVVGVPFSDPLLVDRLIGCLISARNTIWPTP